MSIKSFETFPPGKSMWKINPKKIYCEAEKELSITVKSFHVKHHRSFVLLFPEYVSFFTRKLDISHGCEQVKILFHGNDCVVSLLCSRKVWVLNYI